MGDFRAEAGTGSSIFGVRLHACMCARGRLGYGSVPSDGFWPPQGCADAFSAHLLQTITLFKAGWHPWLLLCRGPPQGKPWFIFRYEDGTIWDIDHHHNSCRGEFMSQITQWSCPGKVQRISTAYRKMHLTSRDMHTHMHTQSGRNNTGCL